VRLGRRIFDNIKRAMRYVVAVHIPIIGVSFLPLFLGYPPILFPAHIAFLEFIIDPACSVVFETVEERASIMRRPPRRLTDPLLNKRVMTVGVLQGLSVFGAVFLLEGWLVQTGRTEEVIRAMIFFSLVLSNVLLIAMNLSWSERVVAVVASSGKALWAVIGGVAGGIVALQWITPLRALFALGVLSAQDWLVLVILVAVLTMWLECLKLVWAGLVRPVKVPFS